MHFSDLSGIKKQDKYIFGKNKYTKTKTDTGGDLTPGNKEKYRILVSF